MLSVKICQAKKNKNAKNKRGQEETCQLRQATAAGLQKRRMSKTGRETQLHMGKLNGFRLPADDNSKNNNNSRRNGCYFIFPLLFFRVPVHFGEYMQLYAFMACIFCGMFAEYGFIAD